MKKFLYLIPLLLICSYANAQTWQQVPIRTSAQKAAGFFGGEGFQAIQDIKYAPSDPNILYMIIDTMGPWKGTDNGTKITWQPIINGFGAMGGQSLGVHPTNPNLVFVAGSPMYHSGVSPSYSLQGIFRTTDGGSNWALVKAARYDRDLRCRGASLFAFSGANTIYAGTHGDGLLRSTDGGTTWTTIVSSPTYITDLKIHPTDSTILYMCTTSGLYRVVDSGGVTATKIGLALPRNPFQVVIDKNTPATMYVTLANYGVYRSTDSGANFSARNNGMAATLSAGKNAYTISISPADPNYLYVSYTWENTVSPYGYFYSHDGGANWYSPVNMDTNNYIGSFDVYYHDVKGHAYATITAVHPTNKDVAITFCNGEQPRRTTDGGQYWMWCGDKYTGGLIGNNGVSTPIGWDSGNPSRFMFFLGDFGPFLTTDGGSTFTRRKTYGWSSLGWGSTNGGAIVPGTDIVVAASGDWATQRLMVTRNLGVSWTEISNTDDFYRFISVHPTNTNVVYAGKYKFTSIQTNNNYSTLSKNVWGMYQGNGNIVYSLGWVSGVTTVYKSTDGGTSWTAPYPTIPASGQVGQVAIAPDNENRIYIAMKGTTPSDKAGIWIINDVSANGGTATLKDYNHGLSKDQFNEMNYYSVTVDPRNPNILYAGQYSAYKGAANGIFRSLDYGNTWSNISGNLTSWFTPVCITVSPYDSYVYVGSFFGTWKLSPPGEEPPPPSGGVPSITTGTVTSIAQTTATFGAMVNSNNSIATVSWKYGTQTGNYTLFTGSQTVNAGSSSASITIDVTGLADNTNYYLVARANNAFGSVSGSETSFSTNQRRNIDAAVGTPTVDGNLTEYTLTTTINNYNIGGTPVAVGTAGVLWSPSYVYVAAQITDNILSASGTDTALWMYDGLEIYFDSDCNFTFDSYTKQFGISYLGTKVNYSDSGTSTGMLVGTATVSGGYKIEVGIPTSLLGLGTLTATQQIGFDLQLNDNNSPIKTSRDGAYSWNNNENTNYYTANKYGKITLIGAGGVGDSALTTISDFALKAMFNEGTGTFLRDSSGNNRHGTITQGASWNSGIGANGALLFDGINDYCTFPEMEYTGTSSISVFALVKPITINPTHYPSIVSKRSNYNNITFQLGFAAGVNLDWVWSDTSGETQFYVGGTPTIGTNSTKCIGAVFNYSSPSSVDYYMGGTKTAKSRLSGTGTSPKDTNVPILVGIAYSSASIGSLPNAVIDNVYILNRAATTQEIIDISTLPLVLTGTATNITSTTATLSGTVTANGSSNTNGYFQYGLVPGIYTGTSSEKSIGTGTTPRGFTKEVSGLSGSTTIYYRAVGYNAANIVYGTETSFNTSSNDITAPVGTVSVNSGATYTLSTGVTLTLTATDAVGVSGYFVSENDTTPYATQTGWFDIGTTTSYSDSKPFSVSNGDGTKTVNVWYKDGSGNISSKAQDSIVLDTVFASIVIGTPTASCNLYTDGSKVYGTSGTSINLSGIAYDINGVQQVKISNSGTTTVLTATGSETWSKTITIVGASGNLISATGYDVPENQGTDTIRIGNYPVPVTGTATNIGTVTVTLNGNLIANLGNTCTAFFEYSTTSDSYVGSSSTYVVNAPGTTTEKPVSISLSGLIPATEYFYRLAASNDIGTTVSYESSFTTTYPPSILILTPEYNCTDVDGNRVFGTSSTNVTITGTASGASDISTVKVSLTGTTTIHTASGTSTWTTTGTVTTIGSNTVSATAFDTLNNQGTDTMKIGNYPVPVTGEALAITRNSATLTGTVTINDAATTTVSFDYGTTEGVYVGSSSTQTISGTSVTDGLVFWAKLDETSGNAVDITSGKIGTRTGTLQNQAGKIKRAYYFDGVDDSVNFGDPADGRYDFGIGSFSFSTMLKPGTTTGLHIPLSKQSTGDSIGYAIYLNYNQCIIRLDFIGDDYQATVGTFGVNNWIHVVCSVDQSNYPNGVARYYFNSVQTGTTTNLGTSTTSNNAQLHLGEISSTAYKFLGSIDDVRIYNRALSNAEVLAIYNEGMSGRQTSVSIPLANLTPNTQYRYRLVGENDVGKTHALTEGEFTTLSVGVPLPADYLAYRGWFYSTKGVHFLKTNNLWLLFLKNMRSSAEWKALLDNPSEYLANMN